MSKQVQEEVNKIRLLLERSIDRALSLQGGEYIVSLLYSIEQHINEIELLEGDW